MIKFTYKNVYSIWDIEEHCNVLPQDDHKAFSVNLNKLTGKLVNAYGKDIMKDIQENASRDAYRKLGTCKEQETQIAIVRGMKLSEAMARRSIGD